jgi:hypothetical protein
VPALRALKQAGKKEGGWGGSVSAIPPKAEYQNRKIFFSLIEKNFGGARLKKCRENFSVLLAEAKRRRAEMLGRIQSAKSSGFCSKKVRISSKQYRQESHFEKSRLEASAQSALARYFSAILKAFLKSKTKVRSAMRKFEPIFLRKSRIFSGFSC